MGKDTRMAIGDFGVRRWRLSFISPDGTPRFARSGAPLPPRRATS